MITNNPVDSDSESQQYRYSLALTSQFYFCGVPFRLDTAPKCPLNCSYCFAMSRGGRRTSTSLLADPARIQRKVVRLFEADKKNTDIIDELLLSKMPVHFGGMSDPFASSEIIKRSLQILHILDDIDYPIVISTKNTHIWQKKKYFTNFE